MKKLLIVLVLIGIVLIGAAYWMTPSSQKNGDEGFTTASVERGDLTETVSATGILQPRNVFAVGSELSGRVVKIYPAGDYNKVVQEGEPLLELDSQMATLTLSQARQDLQKARSLVKAAEIKRDAARVAVEMKQELVQKEVGSRRDLEQAQLQLRAAEADIDAARETLKEAQTAVEKAEYGLKLTTVRAPASGSILERKVVLGQLIAPPISAQLFTIASDLARMSFHAQVAEGDIAKVRKGMAARFSSLYAYPDLKDPFEGTVEEIRQMPANVQGAVFYDTLIDVQNRRDPDPKAAGEWMLRPGMTATVDIVRRRHVDVWKMPTAALNFQLEPPYQTEAAKAKIQQWEDRKDRDEWQMVWVLRDRKPWPLFVRTGRINKEGETESISDGQFKEVLQWDPELQPPPDPKNPASYPQAIITAPPTHKSGLFEQVKLKIS